MMTTPTSERQTETGGGSRLSRAAVSFRKKKKQTSEEDNKSPPYFGSIHFKLDYDFTSNKLACTVVEGKEFPAMDRNGMSDPYVKLYILPERKQKFETKIKRKNLNPVYNETFLFNIPFNELHSKTLMLIVYDFDRLSKDDRIGQLTLPLDSVDFGGEIDEWRDIEPPIEEQDQEARLGDLMNSIPATACRRKSAREKCPHMSRQRRLV
uniref:C2 domain-containing protein n=1 Tax=Plectus sambesii TaxID=2011161 RepID=A0A914WPV8_9BILA